MQTLSKLLILDFGSQYTQLIARRVRELGVYCELHPFDMDENAVRDLQPNAIILSGGPASATVDHTPRAPQIVFDLGVPVLGICYGMQTMAAQLSGGVEQSNVREFGHAHVNILKDNPLLDGARDQIDVYGKKTLDVWMSHGDGVTKLPEGFVAIAGNAVTPNAAMMNVEKKFYAVQFHPEVTHTKQGKKILSNFVLNICGMTASWSMPNFIDEAIPAIQQQVGKDHVLLGLSGGVDSAVAAALLHKAIGDQLTCIFVDHGLLRHEEGKQVLNTFRDHLGVKVIAIDAKERFYAALKGISDPEEKRKVIGREFVHVFQEEAEKIDNVQWLAQGTIYPDVIESASSKTKKAQTIKSHHNVGGLPETLHLKLLEPLRELFKDEVRQLGVSLGLPREMVYRHPFPGPGLGVRILGQIHPEFVNLLQKADHIFIEELRNSGWYDKTSQAFAVFLPVKSVGVMGDGRTYEYVVALRAVQTDDFMTAVWAPIPHDVLSKVSHRIINEVRGINRVVYDISGKPPATIEWE